jgi:predicted AAA+ superfamily ATPase
MVYCIDTGLRNAIYFRFSEDAGKIAENLVFLELYRRKEDIYYWKDDRQHEVDFLLRDDMKVRELIQVAWRIEDAKTKEREIRALLKALDDWKWLLMEK